ncbi:hypothetical protein [Planococcus salinus]|uniref:Group-specific protein n=1 Tax=Planococcus salinus TaxID=1848460 RepID=A0A3M8P8L4_9BACL|nr:hypothetical protein [Planococcus salinus]RNF40003.1 hypothetical protein EEX84_05030 [Planococcus salinus]
MYKTLPTGVKSSITRSISKMFETYMADIEWNENRFRLEDFIGKWKQYIETGASWYEKVPEEVKKDPAFHEEVANKMNQTIEKILSEPPSEDQIARIEIMQERLNTHFDYSCKAEAAYIENKLHELK